MTPQRVTLINFGVKDLTRSKEFYENIGWRAHLALARDYYTFPNERFGFGTV